MNRLPKGIPFLLLMFLPLTGWAHPLEGKSIPADLEQTVHVYSYVDGSEIVFRDYGPFALWLDTNTLSPAVTVHWLKEHGYKNLLNPRPKFYPDSELQSDYQVLHEDYDQSQHRSYGKFDRGHMVPMNDMNAKADEFLSFITTNIAPQYYWLNEHEWEEMKNQIRENVAAQTSANDDKALIFTGPIFQNEYEPTTIPQSNPRIRIPDGFFKIILYTGQDDIVDTVEVLVWWQDWGYDAWPDEEIHTIRPVELLTGLKFLPE